MKKFFNVMLPLCLTFALCSCNSNNEAVSDTSEKKDEIESTFDDETQYEENSSKNKNHCNGDSLEAFYYGEKINLMDYAKNYINDPSLDFENASNYNGFDTSRIYYNPDFDNYKYFKLNDTYYVDFVKDEPILSFVDEAYLQKEGDFGCVGSEYAYYIHFMI